MSIIIKVFCYFILQVTLLLSIVFLFRGHNYPGGGFIGALIACTGVGFYILAFKKPPSFTNRLDSKLIVIGITCLFTCLMLPVFFEQQLLTALWLKTQLLGFNIKLGTPLLFDIGVYLSILGSLMWILSYLSGEAYD